MPADLRDEIFQPFDMRGPWWDTIIDIKITRNGAELVTIEEAAKL